MCTSPPLFGLSPPGFRPSGSLKEITQVNSQRFANPDQGVNRNGFNAAFGIPKQAVTGGWYFSDANTRNIRPSAFVGWNTETGTRVNRGWGTVQGFWNFRTIWIGDWATPLGDALDNAFDVARDTSGWVDPSKITAHLVYGGDRELGYFQYNYGGDWP